MSSRLASSRVMKGWVESRIPTVRSGILSARSRLSSNSVHPFPKGMSLLVMSSRCTQLLEDWFLNEIRAISQVEDFPDVSHYTWQWNN